MYKSISIENFRCFDKLEVDGFQRINLIAGKNNMGKTTILEALFLLSGYTNPGLPFNINAFRGMKEFKFHSNTWVETLYGPLFAGFNTKRRIALRAELGSGAKRVMHLETTDQQTQLTHPPDPSASGMTGSSSQAIRLTSGEGESDYTFHTSFKNQTIVSTPGAIPQEFDAYFQGPIQRANPQHTTERFGELSKGHRTQYVEAALRIMDKRLESLSIEPYGGGYVVHADMGIGMKVPLNYAGDGIMSLASILVAIGSCRGGVVLVDEIENGIHHSVLSKVWKAIYSAARDFDAQVFATTHSWECIVAAHEAFKKEKDYDFRLYRLERVDDEISAVAYEKEILETAIENGMEVR